MADRLAVMHDGSIRQVGAPREVYVRPRSRFVAGFIGETNFIPGNVAEREGDVLHITTTLGRITSTCAPDNAGRGDDVTLSVRPEMVRFSNPPDEAPNMFIGRVHDTVYLGEVAQHQVSIPSAAKQGESITLKAFELNPRILARDSAEPAEVWLDPADVAVLTE
jgi:ABC-type Fe3+/spermidine/putrescine transport system ATPase subunit